MRKFILLDTETTGIDEKDRICQLAFIVADKNGKKPFESLCKPPLPIGYYAMSTHNITNEMVQDKPIFSECESAKKLNELNSEKNILIIQNAPFDLGMLKKEGFEWQGELIDTLRCIKHLQPELESHSLQYLRYALGFYKKENELAKKFGIEIKAHDALGDVVVLTLLMEYLVEKVNRDIQKLIDLTKEPILYESVKFGKHKNSSYQEAVAKDKQYFEWALKNMDLDSDTKYTINYHLQKGQA
ncbi:MAG: exodeoxyribonuclease [Campylobacterota bacterium]|nr:exodeoxyribonuclease [Campylobacterota bacterium]